jgi:sirohydrochlorin cobaltochelatase
MNGIIFTACKATLLGVLGAGLLIGAGTASAAEEDHSQHQSDNAAEHKHNVTPEQMIALRKRIPIYDMFSDDQILGFMGNMKNVNGWATDNKRGWVVSGTRKGDVGILTLAHGFREPGNTQFRAAFQEVAAEYPVTYALGMAMMSSDNIGAAIQKLEDAGVKKIIIMPVTTADNTTLTRQWRYIFGADIEPSYLDTAIVKPNVDVVWTPTPTASPIVADIMGDYARGLSKDPANETLFILGHGPQSKEDNDKELAILANHAAAIKESVGFADVKFYNVQDDAPPDIRKANVAAIRAEVEKAAAAGHRILAVTTQLTASGVVRRLQDDVGPLATFEGRGIMEHPRFKDWINEQIEIALAASEG